MLANVADFRAIRHSSLLPRARSLKLEEPVRCRSLDPALQQRQNDDPLGFCRDVTADSAKSVWGHRGFSTVAQAAAGQLQGWQKSAVEILPNGWRGQLRALRHNIL